MTGMGVELGKRNESGTRVRSEALDGFRGIFLMFVVVGHLGVSAIHGSWIFISGFFAISGFLIASIMLREFDRTGTINVIGFWRRRARRLLPGLFVLLLTLGVWAILFAGDETRRQMRGDLFATAGFVMNWRLVYLEDQYFAQFAEVSFLRHAWTLAIEEQFYLVAPLLVLALLRIKSPRFRLGLLALGMVLSTWWAARIGVGTLADQARVYYGTDTRVAAILAGVFLAFLMHRGIRWSRRTSRAVGIVAFGVSVYLAFAVEPMSAAMFERGGLLAFVLLWTAGMVTLVSQDTSRYKRFLSQQIFVWIGVRIYGIYIWHWPIALWLTAVVPDLSTTVRVIIGVALVFVVAGLSYRFVEEPVMRAGLKGLFPKLRSRLVIAASCVGVLLVAYLVGAVPQRDPTDPSTIPMLVSGTERHNGQGASTNFVFFGDSVPHYLAEDYPADLYPDTEITSLAVPGCGLVQWATRGGSTVSEPVSDECIQAYASLKEDVAASKADGFVLMTGSILALPHISPEGEILTLSEGKLVEEIHASLDAVKADVDAAGVEFTGIVTIPCRSDDRSLHSLVDESDPTEIARQEQFMSRWIDPSEANRILSRWAREHGVRVLDLHGALECPAGYRDTIHGVTMFRDFFHFSQEGAVMIWSWLVPEIRNEVAPNS